MTNLSMIRGALIRDTLVSCKFNEKVRTYVTAAADTTALFIGDFVKTTGVFDSNGKPIVTQGSAGDSAFVGIVAGFGIDPLGFYPYRLASTVREVLVSDDPSIEFEIQANGAITTADAGKRANIIVGTGNVNTGLSAMQLDAATLSSATGQLKIIDVAPAEGNDVGTNTKLICMIADHEFNFYPSGENFWDYTVATNTLTTLPANANVHIGGKLTVDGLIDPTALILTAQAIAPSTVDGTSYYSSVVNKFQFRENGAWVDLGSSSLWTKSGTTMRPTIDGNYIISSNVNGNIAIIPHGSGFVDIGTANQNVCMAFQDTVNDVGAPLNGIIGVDKLEITGDFGYRASRFYDTTLLGWGDFVVYGQAGTVDPEHSFHLVAYGTADLYPMFNLVTYDHSNIQMVWDAYTLDGTNWLSSNAASFRNIKDTNSLKFQGAATVGAGAAITWVDSLAIDASGAATFNKNLTVTGDFHVNGEEFVTKTETVVIEDNLIFINWGEVGAGVTKGYAGMTIDRGSGNQYGFMFNEAQDNFRVGEFWISFNYNTLVGAFALNEEVIGTSSGAKGYIIADTGANLKLKGTTGTFVDTEVITGQTSHATANVNGAPTVNDSTQAVATRQDTPTANAFPLWNNTDARFDTVSTYTYNSATGQMALPSGLSFWNAVPGNPPANEIYAYIEGGAFKLKNPAGNVVILI